MKNSESPNRFFFYHLAKREWRFANVKDKEKTLLANAKIEEEEEEEEEEATALQEVSSGFFMCLYLFLS